MQPNLADSVQQFVHDILDSQQFRDLVFKMALERFGPALANVPVEQAMSETLVNGFDNLSASGLAWYFSQLKRGHPVPLEACCEHMQQLIEDGVSPQRIHDELKKRGKHVEPIWDFIKRFKDNKPSVLAGMMDRVAETRKMLEARDGAGRRS